mgnify:CR=1 FL=1
MQVYPHQIFTYSQMDLKKTLCKVPFSTFGFLKWTVFYRESQTDVVTVMRAVQPDVVMLELCKSRTNILEMDEERILSESQNLTTQRAVSKIIFSL